LHVGPPVWLPLARREEITTAPKLPLISERCRVRAAPGFFSSCSSVVALRIWFWDEVASVGGSGAG
jgi:hypothetical protein